MFKWLQRRTIIIIIIIIQNWKTVTSVDIASNYASRRGFLNVPTRNRRLQELFSVCFTNLQIDWLIDQTVYFNCFIMPNGLTLN